MSSFWTLPGVVKPDFQAPSGTPLAVLGAVFFVGARVGRFVARVDRRNRPFSDHGRRFLSLKKRVFRDLVHQVSSGVNSGYSRPTDLILRLQGERQQRRSKGKDRRARRIAETALYVEVQFEFS